MMPISLILLAFRGYRYRHFFDLNLLVLLLKANSIILAWMIYYLISRRWRE
jgi:hypothetical protein